MADGTSAGPSQGSVAKTRARNARAKEILSDFFSGVQDANSDQALLTDETLVVLRTLIGSLGEDPPSASQAAEGALTILALTLAEGRQLDLVSPQSTDVGRSRRIEGDRSLGDWLCREVLQPRNIPSTQGPFQSSSFRGGYTSDQVRDSGLRTFISWYSDPDRSFDDISSLTLHLVAEFQRNAVELMAMPEILASKLSFLKFGLFRERLLAEASGGAFEQYLLAGLLEQELAATGTTFRIQTKNVGANDAATHAGGDIEVRDGQTLLKAYEVTANAWDTKLAQLDSSARAGLSEVTLVANGVAGIPAASLNEALSMKAEQLGIDVAVLDLSSLIDVLVSRISRHARAEAVVFIYRSLVRWHRREPDLVAKLIRILRQLDLVVEGTFIASPAAVQPDVDESMAQVSALLAELGTIREPDLPNALRSLADRIEVDHGPADGR